MNNKNYCEEHYRAKCDNCPKCDQQITGHMVRTANSAFHPECFTCIGCNKDLAHAEFVMDELRQVFCPECFAKKKAPRCATCKKPIVPGPGQKKAPRLRALGKDYHPDCFKCEVRKILNAKIALIITQPFYFTGLRIGFGCPYQRERMLSHEKSHLLLQM